ncbi:MAG: hypothetical protein AAF389_01220 [Gemmatimonadota bacterium]
MQKDREEGADAEDGVRPVSRSALEEFEHEEISARTNLMQQRGDAMERRRRAATWFMMFGVGPAALAAITLALLVGRPELILAFAGVGGVVQLFRIWREHQKVKAIEKELQDPIDGS